MMLICKDPPYFGTLEDALDYLKWLEEIPPDPDDPALSMALAEAKWLIERKQGERH
jgi:hypothetical protein